jgi:hypothetical protein
MISMNSLVGFAATLVVGFSAHAVSMAPFDKYNLEEGADSLVFTDGKVLSVTSATPRCMAGPPPARCIGRTTVAIEFRLYGCFDDLVVTSSTVQDSRKRKVTLNVTALVISNKRSLPANCERLPTRFVEIPFATTLVDLKENEVDVVFQRRFNQL